MLLFKSIPYIEVGLVDYTDKFIEAMKNWQKYDYAFREKIAKERLQERYDYFEEDPKWATKEYYYNDYLKELEDAKKWDEERKEIENLIQNKLKSITRVTAIVLKPYYLDFSLNNSLDMIDMIELGLKVGQVEYPYINIKEDVLSFVEYQERVEEETEEKIKAETEIRWSSRIGGMAVYLRNTKNRPLKLKEWYEKLSNKSFW